MAIGYSFDASSFNVQIVPTIFGQFWTQIDGETVGLHSTPEDAALDVRQGHVAHVCGMLKPYLFDSKSLNFPIDLNGWQEVYVPHWENTQ